MAKKNLGQRVQELEKYAESMQMALTLAQNLIIKLNNGFNKLDYDVGNLTGHTQELEYRTLAILHDDSLKIDIPRFDQKAFEFKLKAFDEASDQQDEVQGYVAGDVSEADSIVIFTSSVEGKDDAGVFRSRLPLKEALFPELREKLTGVKVGDLVDVEMNNELHHIEVIAVRHRLPDVQADGAK